LHLEKNGSIIVTYYELSSYHIICKEKGETMPKILENVKETLLIEGNTLLQANGYTNLNIRDVAKNSGIAVGTFYNYFSNKDELVREIILNHWEKILVQINALPSSDEPIKTKLLALAQYLDGFFKTYAGVFSAMMVNNANQCPREKIFNYLYSIVENILNYSISKGEITPSLSCFKIARILVPVMFFMPKEKDLTFEDFYNILNLN
jgi:AcrR family transcriptional regulator